MLSDRCLSCLSVTLAYCGQMAGWIKMKLGEEVGLCSGHIVLDGDPAPLPKRGTAPQFSAHVCCGQTAELIKMSLGTEVDLGTGDVVLDGDPLPTPEKRGHSTPNFGPCIVAKRLHESRCHLIRGRPQPRPRCVTLGSSSPLKRGAAAPNFRPMSVVAKRLDGSRCHLVGR